MIGRRRAKIQASVWLVLVCSSFGCGDRTPHQSEPPFPPRSASENSFVLNNKETEKEVIRRVFKVTAPPGVVVHLCDGPIRVAMEADGRVEASITKTCWAETKEQAKANLKLGYVHMDQKGELIRIIGRGDPDTEAELKDTKVQLDPGFLKKAVKTLKKGLRLPFVEVELRVARGARLELKTAGDVSVTGAIGPVVATTVGIGKIVVEQAPCGAKLDAAGDVQLRKAKGAVDLSSVIGKIEAGIDGAVVNATTQSGDIQLRGRLAEGKSVLQSRFGRMEVKLPADSHFRLDARTNQGRIVCGFKLNRTQKNEFTHIEGDVGTNPTVVLKISTDTGDIEVRPE